ncbi:hypothetical protein [Stenotrophomonas acidaminiphila]|uniref:hypothetical protein n=1 Tax=Stenotrophomonas acidaminiphila TaxID=128780 RepID=UPI0028A6E84E|nr:hypothetical protein [Stenotrophomonas acidaminiphila]
MHDSRVSEPLSHRIGAGLATVAILCLAGRVLWQVPEPAAEHRQQRLQVRWLARAAEPVPAPSHSSLPATTRVAAPAVAPPPFPADVRRPPVPTPPPAASSPPVPAAGAARRLYAADGGIALPDDVAARARTPGKDEQLFTHRDELATGVGERATAGLFSKRAAGTRQSRREKWLYGEDIQPAQARRAPDVAFNPSLHERTADLGSEATGDAYKAAPIRHEPLPGLDGEASRRIRTAIGELERRYPRCDDAVRRRWFATTLQQLDALERLEYRYRHGADPVEAEHTLPSAADSAYDLARRALWEAERRMKTCG